MNIEYERRFRLAEDSAQFRQKLGGEWTLSHVLDVTFGPSGIHSMARDGWVVRVRSRWSMDGTEYGTRLEYKARLAGSTWTELGISVSDSLPECAKFLSALGLKAGMVIDRVRATSESAVTISVDDVRWLGAFVELDGPPALVAEFASRTGLGDEIETKAYGDLLSDLLTSDPDVNLEHRLALVRLINGECPGEHTGH